MLCSTPLVGVGVAAVGGVSSVVVDVVVVLHIFGGSGSGSVGGVGVVGGGRVRATPNEQKKVTIRDFFLS